MGGAYSVIADIARNVGNGKETTYYGRNGYTITLSRTDEPEIITRYRSDEKEKLLNYKQYYHKLPEDDGWWSPTSYELKAVNHGNNKQEGLDASGDLNNYREVSVVYWLKDEHNLFPLVIGLGPGNVNYFKRLVSVIGNRWEKATKITNPATLSEYNKLLCKLNNELKSIVIINLNAKNGQKYCGHPSVKQEESIQKDCEEKSKFPTVSVKCDRHDHEGFDKYTHTGGLGSPIKLLSAAHGDKLHSFNIKDIDTQYQEVNVYYSSTDRGKIKPLVIGLVPVSGTQSEYYTFDGKLTRNRNINPGKLLDHLDKQNCTRNDIVVVDLSKRGKYCCGVNGHSKIQVLPNSRNNVPNGYTSYLHLPTGSAILSIHKFKNGSDIHTFTNPSGQITGIYAYFCNNDPKKALLLYVNKGSGNGKWFKKGSGGSNTWTEAGMESLKTHTPSSPNIKQHIEEELKKVCKELKIGCSHADSATTTVSGSSQGSEGSAGSTGSGSGSGSEGSSPGTDQGSGASGHTTSIGNGRPSSSSSGSSTSGVPNSAGHSGVGGGGPSVTEQNTGGFIQMVTKFITSTEGIITASVTPGIGGVIGVAVWKGPSLLARLIARL